MTVQELIEELRKMPQTAIIIVINTNNERYKDYKITDVEYSYGTVNLIITE